MLWTCYACTENNTKVLDIEKASLRKWVGRMGALLAKVSFILRSWHLFLTNMVNGVVFIFIFKHQNLIPQFTWDVNVFDCFHRAILGNVEGLAFWGNALAIVIKIW